MVLECLLIRIAVRLEKLATNAGGLRDQSPISGDTANWLVQHPSRPERFTRHKKAINASIVS
jgi:hypothetical protein